MAETKALTTKPKTTLLGKILSEMGEELRLSREKIREILKAGQEALLLQTWDLGAEVQRCIADPNTFGERPIEKIAESLHVDGFPLLKPTVLYDAADISKVWTRVEVEQFATDGILSVQHLLELKRIASPAQRDKHLKRVIAKRISAKQIRDEISGKGVTTKKLSSKKDGRPLSLPISTAAGMKQLTAFVGKGRKLIKTIWSGYVLARLEKMSDTSVTPKMINDVDQIVADLDAFVSEQRASLDRFRKLQLRMKKLPAAKKSPAAA